MIAVVKRCQWDSLATAPLAHPSYDPMYFFCSSIIAAKTQDFVDPDRSNVARQYRLLRWNVLLWTVLSDVPVMAIVAPLIDDQLESSSDSSTWNVPVVSA